MFIETSSDRFRREIATHLAAFLCDEGADEAIALEIIEIIAWRMLLRKTIRSRPLAPSFGST